MSVEVERGRRKRLKDMGLCYTCGNPTQGNTRCQNCIDSEQKRRTARDQKLREAGICCACGQTPHIKGKRRCQECYDTMQKRREGREQKLKEAGLCFTCGKHRARNASQVCEICTLKQVAMKCLGTTKRYKEIMQLYRRQKGVCPYTGITLKLGTNASLDHRIPRAKGGTSELDNLQWIHKWANLAKSDLDESEFIPMFREFINLSG